MTEPPDDLKIPDDALPPEGPRKRKVKLAISQSAQEVKFADMFGITIAPTHGVVKFGVFQPETGEFVVHTQIALTPQGMIGLSQSLQKNLENVKKRKDGSGPGSGTSMN